MLRILESIDNKPHNLESIYNKLSKIKTDINSLNGFRVKRFYISLSRIEFLRDMFLTEVNIQY